MRPRSRRVKLANRFGLQLLNKAATRFSMSVLGLSIPGAFTASSRCDRSQGD